MSNKLVFSSLKIGDAFSFEENGPVWVKCKGGFRPGRGGQLHACASHVAVCRYTGAVWHPDAIKAGQDFKSRWNRAVCKRRGYKNWKEALLAAWHQGWDDREPMGSWLRSLRNEGGHLWLELEPLSTK